MLGNDQLQTSVIGRPGLAHLTRRKAANRGFGRSAASFQPLPAFRSVWETAAGARIRARSGRFLARVPICMSENAFAYIGDTMDWHDRLFMVLQMT